MIRLHQIKNQSKRLRVLYQCHRQRGKTPPEIIAELVAKHSLPKSSYVKLLSFFLNRYRLRTERDFQQTLTAGRSWHEITTRPGLWQMRFFSELAEPGCWDSYRERFPGKVDAVIADAETICRHEFDLLGSGAMFWGDPIDWHVDPKSGHHWPRKFFATLYPVTRINDDADNKMPWELSRMQHLPTLGKAYGLTGDERYAQEVVAQISDWLDNNPFLIGINWTCGMDVAIRVVNLIWGLAFVAHSPAVTPSFKQRIFVSLWEHGQYLVRHLEHRILWDGTLANHNHYLSNITGLVYLGVLFPEFKAASQWRHLGVRGLIEEMERQVYADGMDFESSTSYHRLVLELFTSAALLCRRNDIALPPAFWDKLEKMYDFTLHITRPDGRVPQVGDADDGRLHILSDYGNWDRADHRYVLAVGAILGKRADMKAAAGTFLEEAFWLCGLEGLKTLDGLGETTSLPGSRAFSDAGIYVMRSHDTYLMASCGPLGALDSGSHKHNDLLSFELTMGGVPFIVDPGAYIYTAAPQWRNCFRATAYHNTVVIDGQEQNRFPLDDLFRMSPDAKPIVHAWCQTDACDQLELEHTGYGRLHPSVCHRRSFLFDKRETKIKIIDSLEGDGEHIAEWFYHFDQGVDVHCVDEKTLIAEQAGRRLRLQVQTPESLVLKVQDGWVSQRYGIKLPAPIATLCGTFAGRLQVGFEFSCEVIAGA